MNDICSRDVFLPPMRVHRKAAQTRKFLAIAFCQLYTQKPIQKISVKAISKRAGYNPCIFYEYFHDVLSIDFSSTMVYILIKRVSFMAKEYSVSETEVYTKWFASLTDERAKARIDKRIDRAKFGNFEDWKTETGEVRAMRIDYGPGYRLYYLIRNNRLIILLCGGDKSNQQSDIKKAVKLSKEI